MSKLPLKVIESSDISLKIIEDVLATKLNDYFECIEVKLGTCPDLRSQPFNFPVSTISEGAILDIGGPQFLIPQPNLTKQYSMDKMLDLCNILHVPNELMFGACAGPFWEVGKNSEMVACKHGNNLKSNSLLGYVDEETGKSAFEATSSDNFGILGNFFVCSEELESTVLRISVQKRKTDLNFTNSIRKSISEALPNQIISLGGVFTASNSRLNCHVMPDFSLTPLVNDEMVNKWLNFYHFASPMTFASVLHCHDPGLNLRMEHSHGFNLESQQLGHYHNDLDPESVRYEGVFCLASKIVRIDMP